MISTRLAIIIPTLNSHVVLRHLVASLQAQTWTDWQAVIVDGGSEEDTISYLQQLCAGDQRFRWLQQEKHHQGIFGAMNQGLQWVADTPAWSGAWLLFWGSDDWAASADVLATLVHQLDCLAAAGRDPDLVICRARYARVDGDGNRILGRRSAFRKVGSYRWSVFVGPTPPHQGTLFGPRVRQRLPLYAEGFDLSADVDYFLRLSRFADADVEVLPIDLVEMSAGGISGQKNKQRFREVKRAYQRRYGAFWWVSYGMRYANRAVDALRGRISARSASRFG